MRSPDRTSANDSSIYQCLRAYRGDIGAGTPYSVTNFAGPFATCPATLTTIGYVIPGPTAQVDSEITRLDNRIINLESFFNYLIQLERQYGIQNPFPYRRFEL